MKSILYSLSVFLLIWSCDENVAPGAQTFQLGDTLDVKYGEVFYNQGVQLGIQFDSLISDSRCPSDVFCIWGGNAMIALSLRSGKNQTLFALTTHQGDKFMSETIIYNYHIQLLELLPYPQSTEPIDRKEYTAKILISTP